jgi:hypothetical protein
MRPHGNYDQVSKSLVLVRLLCQRRRVGGRVLALEKSNMRIEADSIQCARRRTMFALQSHRGNHVPEGQLSPSAISKS